MRKPSFSDTIRLVHKLGVFDGNSEISRLRSAAGEFLFAYSKYKTKAVSKSSTAEILLGSESTASIAFKKIIFDGRNENFSLNSDEKMKKTIKATRKN